MVPAAVVADNPDDGVLLLGSGRGDVHRDDVGEDGAVGRAHRSPYEELHGSGLIERKAQTALLDGQRHAVVQHPFGHGVGGRRDAAEERHGRTLVGSQHRVGDLGSGAEIGGVPREDHFLLLVVCRNDDILGQFVDRGGNGILDRKHLHRIQVGRTCRKHSGSGRKGHDMFQEFHNHSLFLSVRINSPRGCTGWGWHAAATPGWRRASCTRGSSVPRRSRRPCRATGKCPR